VLAAGSVVGALAAARRARPTRRLLFGSAALLGLTALAAAAAPTPLTEGVALAPLGMAALAFMATANSTMQLNSHPDMRGRVMSLYGVVFLGSTPLGGLIVGWLAERFGPRSGLVLAGVASLAAAVVAWAGHRGARRRLARERADAAGCADAEAA
jgi:predicted MFS family arabinose efflux permease